MHVPALRDVSLPHNPSKVDIDIALAQGYETENNLEQALTVANGILDEDPDNAVALLIAGRVAIKMQKHGLAFNLLMRAAEFAPNRWDIRTNLAAACIGMQRLVDAKRLLQEIRRTRPNDEKTLALLCLLAVYDCNPRLAIDLGEKSLFIKKDQWDVYESLGYARLMLGEWKGGWDGYEKFIGKSRYRPIKPPHEDCPYWDGSKNLDLYIRGEQGIGDEISFASVLPEIVGEQKSITLDCDEKLGGLFARSFPGIEVHSTRKAKTAEKDWLSGRKFDAHCLVGSLAYHRRLKDSDFPGTAFLVSDPERRVQWRALLDTLPGKKVGIAWTGGYKNTFRARRSHSLEGLLPILKTPGVSWISLQYQDPKDDIEAFTESHGIQIKHWARAAESQDYDDVAALVSELDLVITVCTAVVHLSGALGKTCWVLVPNKPRWWYGLDGRKSTWYNSVEFFRQTDNWPIEEMAGRLREFAS
jgi:tetratricopeptide (TPR) repeat protein